MYCKKKYLITLFYHFYLPLADRRPGSGIYKMPFMHVCIDLVFTPQLLRAVGVLFSPMVSRWMGVGRASVPVGGRREKFVQPVSQKP